MLLSKNNVAISTSSLGLHPSHSLEQKVLAAAEHGFIGIEIVRSELEAYSTSKNIPLDKGAIRIRQICEEHGLELLSLCPLENFEGHPSPLHERLRVASDWINLARVLGAKHLQIPAQYDPNSSSDEVLLVFELQSLADIAGASEPSVTVAYEPMSWSLSCSTWQDSLRIANLVDRPNFRICLDSFHILSKVWGSPHELSGKRPGGDESLERSLNDLVRDLPLEKLAYVQLSDGEFFNPPYSEEHPWFIRGEAPEFTWSKHARPFPLETEFGGFMPVVDVAKALVVDKKFKGWISLESFDRRMRDKSVEVDDCAVRAERSIARLQHALCQGNNRI